MGEELEATSILTRSQERALRSYAKEGSMAQAATSLGITLQTMKNQVHDAYERLGASSSIQAFTILGWLRPENPLVDLIDIEARLEAIHAEAGMLLAKLDRGSE